MRENHLHVNDILKYFMKYSVFMEYYSVFMEYFVTSPST